jgi:hypothetical protein
MLLRGLFIHGQHFHEQAIPASLIGKQFMGIIGGHRYKNTESPRQTKPSFRRALFIFTQENS